VAGWLLLRAVASWNRAGLRPKTSVYRFCENAEAGPVPMDREPGRIGFMSTQRRVSRWQRTSCTERARALGHPSPAPVTQYDRACANSGTAPPGIPAWLATNSLQTDHHIEQFVRLVWLANRRGSPPLSGAGRCAATSIPATHGSSFSPISIPSGFARLHPTLPQAPAGRRHWAERYDGKRDLHLQHAA
jgi:hypothetical protein